MPAIAKQNGTSVARPSLPLEHANPHLKHIDPSKPQSVKFQEIVRDGQATIVGRLKIQTPNGHAFILRRLDTGAISLTTMFRAAFPTASEDAEKGEANWVRATFDLTGTNKAGRSRFAGTWVTPEVALSIADEYNLASVITILAKTSPDRNVVFRRSARGQQPTPELSPAAAKDPGPGPAKKRREASPATPAPAPATPTPAVPVAAERVAPTPPSPASRQTSTPPRRSTRHKSPAPPPATPLPARTPRSARGTRRAVPTPSANSDETAVDDAERVVDPVAQKIADEVMAEDMREQKALIARLKAQREAAQQAQAQAGDEAEDEHTHEPSPLKPASKRQREDEELKFNFDQPTEEVGERAIATNRRVSVLSNMPPERKSLAWGALAFAVGWGAMTLLPTVQTYLSI